MTTGTAHCLIVYSAALITSEALVGRISYPEYQPAFPFSANESSSKILLPPEKDLIFPFLFRFLLRVTGLYKNVCRKNYLILLNAGDRVICLQPFKPARTPGFFRPLQVLNHNGLMLSRVIVKRIHKSAT